jgi:ArsR family transcriptional regulator
MCDQTRLRILNLLSSGPLCVCHFQDILGEPQVKISKHLAYLKRHGLVKATRQRNWMVYGLPERPSHALQANLACLQDCASEDPTMRRDAERCRRFRMNLDPEKPVCEFTTGRATARRA